MPHAAFQPVEPAPTEFAAGKLEAAQRPAIAPAMWRRLRPDLRQAARDGAFALAFQARRTMAEGEVCGAEAQLRWPSRHHGVVQASVFLPLAEELGLAGEIVGWTLTAACRAALDCQDGVVSVSVPARTAQDGSLLTLVADALGATGLAPHRLEIALPDRATEGDCTETLLSLSALRDLGVGVALEDFGRAGACLVKLKRLPLTTLKLDRSLLRDMLADRSAASMVRAAIDFAHALDVQVVACGVETETQRAFLRRAGCDAVLERLGTAKLDLRRGSIAA